MFLVLSLLGHSGQTSKDVRSFQGVLNCYAKKSKTRWKEAVHLLGNLVVFGWFFVWESLVELNRSFLFIFLKVKIRLMGEEQNALFIFGSV